MITVLSRNSRVVSALYSAIPDDRSLATARSWTRVLWLVKERPVTCVVLDSAALPTDQEPDAAVSELRRRFPGLATVFVARRDLDPLRLFRLGRAGISDLVLISVDDLARDLPASVARASSGSTLSLVLRSLGGRLSASNRNFVRWSLGKLCKRVSDRAIFGLVANKPGFRAEAG